MLLPLMLFGCFTVVFTGTALEPQFEDYPIGRQFRGKPAPVRLVTPGQRRFRSVIEDSQRKGPNFAGHYTLAEWGCGTGCVSMAIVDAVSGEIYDGPFGKLPRGAIYLGPPPDPTGTGLFFRLDSRLLIIAGCPDWKDCARYYYEWQGAKFRLILRRAFTTAEK